MIDLLIVMFAYQLQLLSLAWVRYWPVLQLGGCIAIK